MRVIGFNAAYMYIVDEEEEEEKRTIIFFSIRKSQFGIE